MNFIRMSAVALAATLMSLALAQDASFRFNPAPANPTVTVRYFSGQFQGLELRLNGRLISTRSWPMPVSEGELTFSLPTAQLREGSNEVSVRLFDPSGRLVRERKASFPFQPIGPRLAEIVSPAAGANLQGAAELEVKLRENMGNVYVCFFVNDQFAALKNFPPYRYTWDTTRAANGWHEIEAWVVDEKNQTFKTGKVRVFVNNLNSTGSGTGLQPVLPATTLPENIQSPVVAPTTTLAAILTAPNFVRAHSTAQPAAMRVPAMGSSITTGARHMTPEIRLVLEAALPIISSALLARTDLQTAKLKASAVEEPKLMAPSVAPVVSPAKPTPKPNPAPVKPEPKPVTPKPAVAEVTKPAPAKPTAAQPTAPRPAPAKPTAAQRKTPKPAVAVATKTVTRPATPTRVALHSGTKVARGTKLAVSYQGAPIAFDVKPMTKAGIPVAPIRHIFNQAGGAVAWMGGPDRKVVAQGRGGEVVVKIGSRRATVNEREVTMDLAAFLKDGRAMIPLSFVRDALQVDVWYEPGTGRISITALPSRVAARNPS